MIAMALVECSFEPRDEPVEVPPGFPGDEREEAPPLATSPLEVILDAVRRPGGNLVRQEPSSVPRSEFAV